MSLKTQKERNARRRKLEDLKRKIARLEKTNDKLFEQKMSASPEESAWFERQLRNVARKYEQAKMLHSLLKSEVSS